jgi:hypothetical protein
VVIVNLWVPAGRYRWTPADGGPSWALATTTRARRWVTLHAMDTGRILVTGRVAGAGSNRSKGLVLAVLATAQLVIALDYSIVKVALPDIGRSLDFSGGTVKWVISAYALTFGGFLLLGGAGRKAAEQRRPPAWPTRTQRRRPPPQRLLRSPVRNLARRPWSLNRVTNRTSGDLLSPTQRRHQRIGGSGMRPSRSGQTNLQGTAARSTRSSRAPSPGEAPRPEGR